MDEIAVNQLHAGDGDGADIVFAFNASTISVSIFPANGRSARDSRHLGPEDRPLQDRLIDLLARASVCREDDEYDQLEDEVLGIILDAGRSLFREGDGSEETEGVGGHQSLQDLLFPAIRYFRLEATAGRASILPLPPSESYACLTFDPEHKIHVEEELDIDGSFPLFAPEKIVVTDIFLQGLNSVAAAVQVDGRDMFCKARAGPNGLYGTGEGRELECLEKIQRAFPQQGTIRVPQLLGYVQHKETGRILGFLREWLPGRRLSDMDISATTADRREKWTSQICESVQSPHKEGIV